MARQTLTSKSDESIHLGPGRPGKGKKTLPPGGKEDSRRNGEKITISVTASEKATIEAAKNSTSDGSPIGYADFILSLIAEKDERGSRAIRPALISEAIERINQIGETATEQIARLDELNGSVDQKFGAQLLISKKLNERGERDSSKIKGLEELLAAQSDQLAQLTRAQSQLNARMGQVTELLMTVATGLQSLTDSVRSMSRVSNSSVPSTLPRPQSIASTTPSDRQKQSPLGSKPSSPPLK